MPKLTLPPSRRIKKKLDFDAIKKSGDKFYTEHLIIYALKSALNYPRVGVVVSKKVSKRAVNRNLLKRRLREIFRLNQHQLENVDLLLIAKKQSSTARYQNLSASLLKVLIRSKVLKLED